MLVYSFNSILMIAHLAVAEKITKKFCYTMRFDAVIISFTVWVDRGHGPGKPAHTA